jgi:hypothetical protein
LKFLKKEHDMVEKDMQVLFGKYLKSTPPKQSEVYELKICKGNALPFDKVKDRQIDVLYQVNHGSYYHKLTDPPIFEGMKTRFNVPRPFDCFCLVNVPAFIIVWFYKPREKKVFIKISIEDFIDLKKREKRKSMTEEMALEIGKRILI